MKYEALEVSKARQLIKNLLKTPVPIETRSELICRIIQPTINDSINVYDDIKKFIFLNESVKNFYVIANVDNKKIKAHIETEDYLFMKYRYVVVYPSKTGSISV